MRTPERLARLEGPRDVTDALLEWLERAHAWESSLSYQLAILDPAHGDDAFAAAMERLMDAVNHATRGHSRQVRAGMIRTTHRDAVYLHSLATTLESTVAGAAVDWVLTAERLAGRIDRLFPDPDARDGPGRIHVERARTWLSATAAIVSRYESLDTAVAALEYRHFRGRPVTFPETRRAWEKAGESMRDLRTMGEALTAHVPEAAHAPMWTPSEADVAGWRRRLDLGARVDAFLRLGEQDRALEYLPMIMGTSTAEPAPPS